MIINALFNDLAHIFAFALGPVIVFTGSAVVVGSVFYSLTAVTIFMIRNQD